MSKIKEHFKRLKQTTEGFELIEKILKSKNYVKKEIETGKDETVIKLTIPSINSDRNISKSVGHFEHILTQLLDYDKEQILNCDVEQIKVVNRFDYTWIAYIIIAQTNIIAGINALETMFEKQDISEIKNLKPKYRKKIESGEVKHKTKRKERPYLKQVCNILKMQKGYLDNVIELHFEQIEEYFGPHYLYAINNLIEGYMKIFKLTGNIDDTVSLLKRLGEEVDESELSNINLEALQVVNNAFDQLKEERNENGDVTLDKYTFNYITQNLALAQGSNLVEYV